MKKRAVMDLPFTFIFALILIIAFIVVAFYVIRSFMCTGDITKSGIAIQNLQANVDEVWNSPEADLEKSYNIPRADYACFIDFNSAARGEHKEIYEELEMFEGKDNLFFYPQSDCTIFKNEIKHIDIEEITFKNNPYCFEVKSGRITVRLQKGLYEKLTCLGEDCIEKVDSNEDIEESSFCGSSTQASCVSDSDCKTGGCSRQVCEGINENTITICDVKPCYNAGNYGLSCRCSSGKCKWD